LEVMVDAITLQLAELKMPPPSKVAELPVKVLVVMVQVRMLLIPPPA